MDTHDAAHALALVSAELIEPRDTAGGLVVLLRSCRAFLDTEATGVLVESAHEGLELLASSSHVASELEVLQAQLDEGPCVDAHASGENVQAAGSMQILHRWPTFGRELEKAGYASVHASPLRWQGEVFGSMGAFRRSDRPFDDEELVFAQAFADLASVMIVSLREVSGDELRARLDETLAVRIVVEQAKGVLAERRGVSMDEAHSLLLDAARESDQPLAVWARAQVEQARGASRSD
jgi:signal transduction protein with GAF and PtsI domain